MSYNLLALLFSAAALAFFPVDADAAKCAPSASSGEPSFYPGKNKIPTSNNLRRKVGAADFASGIPVEIKGTLYDENCVPMSQAEVQLWQPNANGRHHHSGDASAGSLDPNFAGAGRTVTDNAGRFTFLTIYPGKHTSGTPPHFHLRVKDAGFKQYETELYLSDDMNKDSYNTYKALSQSGKDALTGKVSPQSDVVGGLTVEYTLTLKGQDPLRGY